MSGGAVVTIARNSVVASAFLFIFLASTCVGSLHFPFLTVNGPRLVSLWDYKERFYLLAVLEQLINWAIDEQN